MSISSADEEPSITTASHLLEAVLLEHPQKTWEYLGMQELPLFSKNNIVYRYQNSSAANHLKQSENFEPFIQLLLTIIQDLIQSEEWSQASVYLHELYNLSKDQSDLFFFLGFIPTLF